MGVVAVALSAILFPSRTKETKSPFPRSYEEIVQSGVLRAVTEYNSISFHVQEDTLGGLHYELLHAFAQKKGLKVDLPGCSAIDKPTVRGNLLLSPSIKLRNVRWMSSCGLRS